MNQSLDGALRSLVSDSKILSAQEEKELIDRWLDHGDIEARHQLLESHSKLIASFASKFASSGMSINDLYIDGYEAMIKAADKFDRTKNARFSTYATWWIFNQLQSTVHQNIHSTKIGRSKKEKKILSHLQTAKNIFGPSLSHTILQAIADFSNTDIKIVTRICAAVDSKSNSLNTPVNTPKGSSNQEFGDTLEDQYATSNGAEAMIMNSNQKKLIDHYFAKLTDIRAAEILRDRYFPPSGTPTPFDTIKLKHGVSKERIRQIERTALREIKQMMDEDGISITDLIAT